MGYLILVINIFFYICYLLIILRAIFPFFPHHKVLPGEKLVFVLTDFVLRPIRLGLPPTKIGMDVSPFVALILIWLLHQVIINIF